MKLYLACKKQFNIILLIILLALSAVPAFITRAQTAAEVQMKIAQKNSDIAALEQEIAAYQAQLDNIGKQKDTLNKSIQELDIARKSLVANINITQKKIDKTNIEIQSLSSDIKDKQEIIADDIDSIKAGIQKTDELERSGILETLLSGSNFTTVWNDIDNIVAVRENLRDNIDELQHTKTALEGTRTETVKAKNELVALKSKLSDQRKIVEQNKNEKNQLLKQTKNSEANYQKLVQEQLAKKLAYEQEIEDYESQLKYILDPSKIPTSRVLSWPLDKIYVTSPYA